MIWIYKGPEKGIAINGILQFHARYILEHCIALQSSFQKLMIAVYFMQTDFQMTAIFKFEIYAIIVTAHFTSHLVTL